MICRAVASGVLAGVLAPPGIAQDHGTFDVTGWFGDCVQANDRNASGFVHSVLDQACLATATRLCRTENQFGDGGACAEALAAEFAERSKSMDATFPSSADIEQLNVKDWKKKSLHRRLEDQRNRDMPDCPGDLSALECDLAVRGMQRVLWRGLGANRRMKALGPLLPNREVTV